MKTLRLISLVLLCILCTTALYGSYHMINDPSGNSLRLPFYLLYETVFNDYISIGWILLIVVGFFSFFVIFLVLFKSRVYSFFIILQGVFLCIFIFVQLLLLNETFWIQYAFLALGIGLIYLGALQNQKRIEGDKV
jgi:hypothetical protein